MDKQIPADAGVGAKGTKRSDETYREVGQAHGGAILFKLLLADNPTWTRGMAWKEVDRILTEEWDVHEEDLIKKLQASLDALRGESPCRIPFDEEGRYVGGEPKHYLVKEGNGSAYWLLQGAGHESVLMCCPLGQDSLPIWADGYVIADRDYDPFIHDPIVERLEKMTADTVGS